MNTSDSLTEEGVLEAIGDLFVGRATDEEMMEFAGQYFGTKVEAYFKILRGIFSSNDEISDDDVDRLYRLGESLGVSDLRVAMLNQCGGGSDLGMRFCLLKRFTDSSDEGEDDEMFFYVYGDHIVGLGIHYGQLSLAYQAASLWRTDLVERVFDAALTANDGDVLSTILMDESLDSSLPGFREKKAEFIKALRDTVNQVHDVLHPES